MESVDKISKDYNEYIPNITVEDFIAWIEAFLDDLREAKKDYEKEKRRYRFKHFFRIVEYSDDEAYYSELNEVLDEGIRITLVMKDFVARTINIASDNNATDLFKLMKYAAKFYFKYTDHLDKKLDTIITKYSGITVMYAKESTRDFENFMNGQIENEEEKSIPPVPKSEMERLDFEYDEYVVDDKFIKATEDTIFLWMRLDTQMKYLDKKARKYAHKSEICERVASFLNSDALEKRSCCFEEMQLLTEEQRDILSFIRSATNNENLDEMRKLSDFATNYYGQNMRTLNEELGNFSSSSSVSKERRRAAIKRFVLRKVGKNPQKQFIR